MGKNGRQQRKNNEQRFVEFQKARKGGIVLRGEDSNKKGTDRIETNDDRIRIVNRVENHSKEARRRRVESQTSRDGVGLFPLDEKTSCSDRGTTKGDGPSCDCSEVERVRSCRGRSRGRSGSCSQGTALGSGGGRPS